MSHAFIDEDERFALELSRSLNANPRRVSATKSTTQTPGPLKTPIRKRSTLFRSPTIALPITPVSLASTPSDARYSSDGLSLDVTPPLMKLRSSSVPITLQEESLVGKLGNDAVSNTLHNRKPRGLTNISISEADMKSIPPPGAELLRKVELAKAIGEVPMLYDSSVIRCINGKWLVPQMCDSCREILSPAEQYNKWQKCDRGNPCSICTRASIDCVQGNFMALVFGTRRLSQHSTPQKLGLSESEAIAFPLASHVGQNQDGTWTTAEQTLSDEQRHKKRKAEEPLAPLLRLQKREKINRDDVDVVPDLVSHSSSHQEGSSYSTTNVVSIKRRVTAKKIPGVTKYHQSMQEDKPAPYGQPPVWADKRQSLCETLPYYRAYMSGAYMHEHMVRAFMVDKEVGPRDKFGEEIMISRVGGGRKLDEKSGQMIQKVDQDRSSFALGFQRAMNSKSPVAIIAGQGNRISTSKLPHYYNVLDWFHVTDVWCEKSKGFKCWMVRLEKIRLDTKSWWASVNSPPLNPNRNIDTIKTSSACCILCKVTSKGIYNAGWACLNTKCDSYFSFGVEINDTALDYNEEFIHERTRYTGEPLDPLVPPLLDSDILQDNNNFGFESLWNTGIVCPICRGCSRRTEWRQWTCETLGCGFTHSVLQKTMKVSDAIAQSFCYDKDWYDKSIGIKFGQQTLGMYDVYEYVVPGEGQAEIAGIIRHFAANGIINGQPDGPNDLFRFMQERDFDLKRYPARQKGCEFRKVNTLLHTNSDWNIASGEILTSHFAANWGAPYKYGVSVLSKGFAEAPSVIIKALKRLTWAGQQTLADTVEPFHPFNELLSIGYFEETSIGYHDDGEKELGPTVASLSLGSQAMMTFRPKGKCRIGAESRNAKGTKSDVLKMVLRHGDLVVMHGTGIQKLYEHAVMPQGKLRFALTCRYVRPELMANDVERQDAEIKGTLPDGHEAYTYDGDTGRTLIPLDEESENVSAAQTAMNQLSARALSGELNMSTLRECRNFLGGLIDAMALPEGRASSPPLSDTPTEDAQ